MAKVLRVEDEQGHKSHPGCMSGIFHALDYHHWHSNVKKIRKHETLIKHTKRNRRYQRISDDQDHFEVLRLLDTKTSHIIQMDQRNGETSSTQKRSLKARIKAFVSEDTHKEQDQDSVSSPKLQRTYSIHHLETNEWVHPISFFPEKVTESPEINNPQDVLDMFEVNKDLFTDTLQDFTQALDIKPKLTKSGSFPSGSRSLMPMKLKDKLNESYTISKARKVKNSNEDVIRLRRISSLNESADRYTQMFDFSVGKEAALRSSRSLKLTSGSENILSAQQLNLFRSFSQNERNLVSFSVDRDKYAELNSTQDCESFNEVIDENEDSLEVKSIAFGKDSHGLKIEDDNHRVSQENTQESPVLVTEYSPPDEKVQISEGLDLLTNSHENLKKEIKAINSEKPMNLTIKDDDFTYVKKILERSGFFKNGFQQPWYSSNQPLDPFVFQELESHYHHDPNRFAEEVNELSHRLLVFDLVDEILLTLHERSSTYYPKNLSFPNPNIRPDPTGSLVLDEVWNRMSRLINLKHDMNESLNDIVARDLRSGDGWMNLQLDLECVGLDLEDLILDEVLEELLFEFI